MARVTRIKSLYYGFQRQRINPKKIVIDVKTIKQSEYFACLGCGIMKDYDRDGKTEGGKGNERLTKKPERAFGRIVEGRRRRDLLFKHKK